MSVMNIYENAPPGSLVRYRDLAAQPSEHDRVAIDAWRQRNGVGWLVRRRPPRERPAWATSGTITLQHGDFVMDLHAAIAARRDFPLECDLSFQIIERPAPGNVRVLQEYADNSILLYLAENRDAAERWLAESRHLDVRLEEVSADEVSADVVEGRVR